MAPRPANKKASQVLAPVTIDLADPPGTIVTRIDTETRIHYATCDLCGTEIKMTVSANRHNLLVHRNKEGCKTRARQKSATTVPILTAVVPGKPCPGVSIIWTPGSHWMTYPYLKHGVSTVGWEPISFGADNTMQFRSDSCYNEIPPSSSAPCIPCAVLPSSSGFIKFMERATESLPHTPWEYLSADQQLKLSNAKKSSTVAQNKISEYRRMTMLLAANDIPGLRRMLTVLAKRGANPRAICSTLDRAINKTYAARGGFNERDLDVGFLVKAIGGPRLLYALSKSHGLPSATTIRRHKKNPKLLPSIGIPTREEISANIASFLDPDIKPPPQPLEGGGLPGNVLMFDGIALETKCRYCPYRNAILGLCREHSHLVNTSVESLESVEDVRCALQKDKKESGKVCFGSDATVVAIAPYARQDHYTPIPLVLSPSDKTEKGAQLAEWMQVVLDTWDTHPQGRVLHGRIDALASDGDSSYRLAKHLICMVKEVDPTSPLGKIVCPLLGLNCYMSKDEQLSTCDPKHIVKRDATLLRNSNGIMVGKTNIQPHDIVEHLAALPDVTLAQAKELLDPSDKQDVPKAVTLIQRLCHLKDLPPPSNPIQTETRRSIAFFSRVLSYFLLPFITVEMSLSEQVESLSTYAFLAAALEMKHGSFCFTGPLYSDSQATIKNIIFTIAKMQLVNPNLKFYIIMEGTDRLEVVFSDCRTQDHARNFDIEQLAGKLAVGVLITPGAITNPDLDRGHRRLSVTGALGIDHLNPRSWIGNARVGDVDIDKQWHAGEVIANNLLEEYFGPSGRVDFSQRFSKAGFDLLRPLGHYVGLDAKHEDKRSEEENEQPLFPPENPDQEVPPAGNHSEERLVSSQQIHLGPDENEDHEYQDMPLGIDLDQFLPDHTLETDNSGVTMDEIPSAANTPVTFSKVLEVEGKKYLKASLVATLSSNRSKKATMRTLRVRGVALEDLRGRKSEQFDPTDLDNDNVLKSGDLVASLVRTAGTICLGIFVVKGIRVGADKSIRTAVSFSDVETPDQKTTVITQLMEMRNPQVQGVPSEFWEWTGNYLCLDINTQEERETRRLFVAELPGVLVHPISPSVSKPASSTTLEAQATWSIPSDQRKDILEDAWQSLDPTGKEIAANVAQLLEVANPGSLPYCDAVETPSLIVQNVPAHLTRAKLRAADKIPCLICGAERKLNEMRQHPVGSEPCGFCGLDGCFTQLLDVKHPKKPVSIKSSCPYHYSRMNYKKAMVASRTSPSTNVPIHCLLCAPNPVSGDPQTIWKYNAMYHIIAEHSLHNNFLPPIPPKFMLQLFIRRSEEDALGITAAQTAHWRHWHHIPDSDVFDQQFPGSDPVNPGGSDKRARANTASTTSDVSESDRHRKKKTSSNTIV
ncbi:hypothetical protein C8F04DRAFT_1046127 [Mycena alexandri]|uniref:C2H2-type domain-containing protein n=1 Tax=Mycena alexandri TaxID=1745969 RepID=A0AAD6SDU5_9AGAR|nr:hypothetical protein C8F04DRAFT_1046127 [Mycena alexandri]